MGIKNSIDILRVNNLSVRLGNKVILEDIGLNVKKGEILGIVGVSGVGKTTLLNSIIGYYPLLNGAVKYRSEAKGFVSVMYNLNNFKRLFGFSAQNPSFYPELTVTENLEYFASLYDVPEKIKEQNIKKALKLVQLEDDSKVCAKNLSGGMKKRLDIACAIAHNPKILILDEPTSDMDPVLRERMWSLIEEINKNGTTIIVASHFLSEVEHTCDRIVFLRGKRAEFIGTPKEFRNLYSKIKEICISTSELDTVLEKIASMKFLEIKQVSRKNESILLHSKEDRKTISKALSGIMKHDISNIEITSPSLDMLFKVFAEK